MEKPLFALATTIAPQGPLLPLPDVPPGVRLKECRYGRMAYLANDQYIGRSLDYYGEYCEGEGIVFEQLVKAGQIVIEEGPCAPLAAGLFLHLLNKVPGTP